MERQDGQAGGRSRAAMADRTDTVYLKADASVEVDQPAVALCGDLFQIGGARRRRQKSEDTDAIRLLRCSGNRTAAAGPSAEGEKSRLCPEGGGGHTRGIPEAPRWSALAVADVIVTYREPAPGRESRCTPSRRPEWLLLTFAGGGLLHHGLQPTMWM